MCFFRPISISLSPNTEKDDIRLALKLLFSPRRRKENLTESGSLLLEEEFKRYLGVKYAVSFNSGRSAFMAILNSLGLEEGSEVLLQAFTCNAAVNPIIWAGLKPVYVDCDEKTFNIDIEDLKRTLRQGHSAELSRSPQGKNPKVLMVQHTFGLLAEMNEILEICQQNNLILIEDCAHSLGAEYKGRKVGSFGKAAFFSFSRDKVISSVYGGMAVTNDDELAKKLREFQEKIGYPSYCWIFQQLLHPILMNWLILPTYKILGKYLLILFQWFHILSKAVHWKEKRGKKPGYFPKRLPDALAELALNQFKKLERFNEHRRKIAAFYQEALKHTNFILPLTKEEKGVKPTFMRYPVLVNKNTDKILKAARKRKIYLDDGWKKSPIVPPDTDLEKMKYQFGVCPRAEKVAKTILNLPTHINISQRDAQKIIDFLKIYGS